MKPITKIVSLSIAIGGIMVFWLIPKINQASDLNYVRVIEDTDTGQKVTVTEIESRDTSKIENVKPEKAKADDPVKVEKIIQKKNTEEEKAEDKKAKKKYKKEVIKSTYRLKDIDPSMYSRAIHFSPEEDLLILDTLSTDSIVSIQ